MEVLINYYRNLFWSPEPIRSFGDYFLAVLGLLPVWALLWWLAALIGRALAGDLRLRFGTLTAVRLLWGRSALLLSLLLLIDISLVWYLDKLSDWTAITPHITVSIAGAVIALWTALRLRSWLSDNRKRLFAALPKANVAAAR